MVLGWVFGRHLVRVACRDEHGVRQDDPLDLRRRDARRSSSSCAGMHGYGNMCLPRTDGSLAAVAARQQVPAIDDLLGAGARASCFSCLALLRTHRVERIGVRENGVVPTCSARRRCSSTSSIGWHSRFRPPASACAVPATRPPTYVVAAVMLLLLYPACRWYRSFKAATQVVPQVHLRTRHAVPVHWRQPPDGSILRTRGPSAPSAPSRSCRSVYGVKAPL